MSMKETTIQDIMDARKRSKLNSVATVVTGDIVESEAQGTTEDSEDSEE
jgi:hypothetical protein